LIANAVNILKLPQSNFPPLIVLTATTALIAALTVDALAGGEGFNRGGFGVREYVGSAQDGAHIKGNSEIRYR
jgi:hypothetical protein